jgi:hypothetical protein
MRYRLKEKDEKLLMQVRLAPYLWHTVDRYEKENKYIAHAVLRTMNNGKI